jgi:transcriptional regulator with XRE-family HTH domain
MNTKLNSIEINPAFEDLFTFKNKEDKIEHDAQMISYRILSELEKICDQKNISKKALADMVGTSKSYITQLFNGTKSINTSIMAKFEHALDARFEVSFNLNTESASLPAGQSNFPSIDLNDLIQPQKFKILEKRPERKKKTSLIKNKMEY